MSDKQGEKFAQHINDKASRPQGGTPASSRKEVIAAIDAEITNLRLLERSANASARVARGNDNAAELTAARTLAESYRAQRKTLAKTKPRKWSRFKGWVKRRINEAVGKAKPVGKTVANVLAAVGKAVVTVATVVATTIGFVAVHVVHAVMFVWSAALLTMVYLLVAAMRVFQFLGLLLTWPKNAINHQAKAEFGVFFSSLSWRRMQILDYRRACLVPDSKPGTTTLEKTVDKAHRRRPVRPPVVVAPV